MRIGWAWLLLPLFLGGCWDRVELENRTFVLALGVDKVGEGLALSIAPAVPHVPQGNMADTDVEASDEGETGEAGDPPGDTQAAASFPEALHALNRHSSRDVFLGQAKTVVLGTDLLGDATAFRHVMYALDHHRDIDLRIGILATAEDVSSVLDAHPSGEAKPGYYVANYYRIVPKSGGRAFYQDFQRLTAQLRTPGAALVPLVSPESNGGLKIAGAAVMAQGQMVGQLDGDTLRGVLWSQGGMCRGALLSPAGEIPLEVRKHRARLRFTENENGLRCIIDVRVCAEATLKEARREGVPLPPQACPYENFIAQEVLAAVAAAQAMDADIFRLEDALRRFQPHLYAKYKAGFNAAQVEVVPLVQVV